MTVKLFLFLGGIPGEAQDRAAHDSIEVQSWSWGVSQATSSSPGASTGRPNIQNLMVTKWIDRATPRIYEYVLQGRHIPGDCRLTCLRNDGGKFLEITLTDCTLASVMSGGKDEDTRLSETLTIHFARVKISYLFPSPGERAVPVEFGWDCNRNAPA